MSHYPHDRVVDERTIIDGLPQSNNIFPNVQEPPNVPQGLSRALASELRTRFQNGLNRSPLHCLTYNIISENFFNNQVFGDAVYYATGFVGYVGDTQNMPLEEAAQKAIAYVAMGVLGQVLFSNNFLYNMMPGDQIPAIEEGGRRYANMIIPDVNDYMARNQNRNYGNQGGGMNLGGNGGGASYSRGGGAAPSNLGGSAAVLNQYNRREQRSPASAVRQNAGQAGPRVHNHVPNTTGSSNSTNGGLATAARQYNRVNNQTPPEQEQTGPLIEQWGGPEEVNTMTPSRQNELDRDDIPKNITEIVVDPYHFIPDGFAIDDDRPFDTIYVPGNITLVPAYQNPHLTVSKNDVCHWPAVVDPTMYCRFLLIWPDGFTQDFPVEWRPEMEYLKHEINDALRTAHLPDTGKLTTTSRMTAVAFAEPKTKEEIDDVRMNMDIDESELNEYPRVLSSIIIASSPMEEESLAWETMVEEFEIDQANDITPPYVYLTEELHPLTLSEEATGRLFALLTATSLPNLARGLIEMLKDGLLPLRYYRFINQRFTQVFNKALAENLCIEDLKLDNFVDDIGEMMEVLATDEAYDGTVKLLEARLSTIIELAMNLRQSEGDNGDELFIVDQRIQYQVGFPLSKLSDLQVNDVPQLIMKSSSPTLSRLAMAFVSNIKRDRRLPGRPILITADGVYLEIIAGWLGEKNFLIKRIDL